MNAGPLCPLCKSGSVKQYTIHGQYALYDCSNCLVGFCLPFKNPGPQYYEHKKTIYAVDLQETTDPMSFEYDVALTTLIQQLPQGAKLLDIGCGAGGFLHRAREVGFNVTGIDFNTQRAAALKQKGFEIFCGGLIEYSNGTPKDSFDAITMFQVFEHLDDANEWLVAAKSLLKPGGVLIVCTPNRERTFNPFKGPGMEDIDNPPHHLTKWNRTALSNILSRNGFTVNECRALGYPLPLLQLMFRNTLRFGLAAQALSHSNSTQNAQNRNSSKIQMRELIIEKLVGLKELILNVLVAIFYPLFKLVYALFHWQGAVIFSLSAKA